MPSPFQGMLPLPQHTGDNSILYIEGGGDGSAASAALAATRDKLCETALGCLRQHASGLGALVARLSHQEQDLAQQLEVLRAATAAASVRRNGAAASSRSGRTVMLYEQAGEYGRTPNLEVPAGDDMGTRDLEWQVQPPSRDFLGGDDWIPGESAEQDLDDLALKAAFGDGRAKEKEQDHTEAERFSDRGSRHAVSIVATSSQSSSSDEDPLPGELKHLQLAQVWVDMMDRRPTLSRITRAANSQTFALQARKTRSMSGSGSTTFFLTMVCLANKLPFHPFGWFRFGWDVVSVAFIMYDCVAMPLRTFDLPMTHFFPIMARLILLFWVLDIAASATTGYYKEGIVVLRFRKILRNYAKSWLAFDLAMVLLDTVYVIFGDWSTSTTWSFGSLGSFLDVLRILRISKLPVKLGNALERAQSEVNIILIDIIKLILLILFANHLIACLWYKMGVWEHREGNTDTWIKKFDLSEAPIGYRYATALHWSLTQFTPASMEVVPTNTMERIFTVAVVTIALISFSSIVSSITNATTRLRYINQDKLAEYTLLRKYLSERSVRADLLGNVWAHIDRAWNESQGRTHEKQVKMLELLPRSLHSDLQHEVYSPTLVEHPFFQAFAVSHDLGVRRLYQCTLKEVSLSMGMELFTAGDQAHHMYFVVSGQLDYDVAHLGAVPSLRSRSHSKTTSAFLDTSVKKAPSDFSGVAVRVNGWVSEAVLWVAQWHHQGHLTARRQSEVLGINAEGFQRMLKRELTYVWQVNRYAQSFVEAMSLAPHSEATDVWGTQAVLEPLVKTAFQLGGR